MSCSAASRCSATAARSRHEWLRRSTWMHSRRATPAASSISPRVATLPDGWEDRLIRIQLEPELAAWFLEPNDAAVSKYARMEPRDREWIRPGLRAGVLSLAILDARFSRTSFLDAPESQRARKALEEDRRWLRGRRTTPR